MWWISCAAILRSDRSRQPVWDASGHLVESVASDEAVESTITAIMRKHLRKKQKTMMEKSACGKRWMTTSCGVLARSISMKPHSTKP